VLFGTILTVFLDDLADSLGRILCEI